MSIKNQLSVSTPSVRVTATLGLIGAGLILIVALLFRFEFGAILLTVAGVIGAWGLSTIGQRVVLARQQARQARLEYDIRAEDLRALQIRNDYAETFLSDPGRKVARLGGQVFEYYGPPSLASGREELRADLLSPAPEPVDSLAIIRRKPHLWVCGETRSGKTSLILNLAQDKDGDLYIIDPKPASLNAWPAGALVAGQNDNQAEAAHLFQHFIRLARDRMKRTEARQIGHLRPLILLIDETSHVMAGLADPRQAWADFYRLASIGAELQIYLIMTSTGANVGTVGADGRGDMLSNFAKFQTVKENGTYQLRYYPDPTDRYNYVEAKTLGPYHPPTPPGPIIEAGAVDLEEQRVRLLIDQGLSNAAILRQMGWKPGRKIQYINQLRGN